MWFGTKEYAGWIPTPLSGAGVSPDAWTDSGTFINGGGYGLHSYNSHKTYDFSWRKTSTREMAQLIKSYFEGTYGRGKIYFHDPLTYDTNVLPARWADPSITVGFEGPSLVEGIEPRAVNTENFRKNRLPVKSAFYDLQGTSPVDAIFGDESATASRSVYIPIPEGMTLHIGAFFEADQGAGIFVSEALENGEPSQVLSNLTALENDSNTLFNTTYSAVPGVYLWIGHDGSGQYPEITITAMHARLTKTGSSVKGVNYWLGGQGHNGVRFAEPPSYINHSGVDGGQVETGAVFIESEI